MSSKGTFLTRHAHVSYVVPVEKVPFEVLFKHSFWEVIGSHFEQMSCDGKKTQIIYTSFALTIAAFALNNTFGTAF
jgi:hypothetical protein